MSRWTYVTGWLQVCPLGRTQEEIEFVLRTVLNHLPVVQGSEENMYVHVIRGGGHSCSSSCDEYDETTNNLIDYWHGPRYNSRRGWLVTQDNYYIFIEGRFRDRYFNETYRQIVKWITRLAKRVQTSAVDVLVHDDWHKSSRITTDLFESIWEFPSWSTWRDKKYICPYEDYDTNWCEHLLWWAEHEIKLNDECGGSE